MGRRQIIKGQVPGSDLPHPVLEPRPQTTIPGIKEVADSKYKPKGRREPSLVWSQVDRRQIVKGQVPGEDKSHPVKPKGKRELSPVGSQVDRRQIIKGQVPGSDLPHPVLEPRPQTTIPGIKEVADSKYKPKGRRELSPVLEARSGGRGGSGGGDPTIIEPRPPRPYDSIGETLKPSRPKGKREPLD